MRLSAIPTTAVACAALTLALVTGCQSGGDDRPSAGNGGPPSSSPPHGYVAGAEEAAEQQSRLVLADAGSGAVRVLDLITGDVTPAGRAPDVRAVTGDGRFAFLDTGSGARVVDSGAWTVDHGDHVHYYRAKIRAVGEIRGQRPRHIHSDPAVTAVAFHDDGVRLFDRTRLEDGTVGDARTLDGPAGTVPVVPYREHLLVPGAGDARRTVEVRDRKGAVTATLDQPCPRVRGAAVTRRGVVFGCSDGALLVSAKNDRFTGVKIPFGSTVADRDRPADFRHRAGSTTLTARSGDDAVWILDATRRTWKRVRTGPVLAANTAGEGAPLLVLTGDGVLTAYDPATGERTARTRLLTTAGRTGPAPVIEVDTSRAYVNDAAARKVYEIDYNDDLRLARTFSLDVTPTYMVETGR